MLQRFTDPRWARIEKRMSEVRTCPLSIDDNIVGIVDVEIPGVPCGLEDLGVQRHVAANKVDMHAVEHVRPALDDDRSFLDDLALERLQNLFAGIDDAARRAPVE